MLLGHLQYAKADTGLALGQWGCLPFRGMQMHVKKLDALKKEKRVTRKNKAKWSRRVLINSN